MSKFLKFFYVLMIFLTMFNLGIAILNIILFANNSGNIGSLLIGLGGIAVSYWAGRIVILNRRIYFP